MPGLLAACLLLMTGVAFAAAPPTPESLDAMAQKICDAGGAPGFAVAVQWQGHPYFSKGYGLADVVARLPMGPETRFAIGSISKQFAAVSLLQLMQKGKLSLSDTVGKYFPALPNASSITLQMLLNQLSGLHNYPLLAEHDWPRTGQIPTAKLLAIVATDNSDFAPGERYAYSNTNYLVAAAIVEKIAGMPYGHYLQANIFKPLGMASSGNGFAAQHDTAVPVGGQGDPRTPSSLDLFQGAGSVVSTVTDLARWDEALMQGQLLTPASMKLLWTPGVPRSGASDYAMGFVKASVQGHVEMWHNGLTPGAGGYNLNAIFPDDRLSVIVLSNGPDFQPKPEQLVKAIAVAFLGGPPQAGPAAGPVEDPAVTALARKIYGQMRAGKVDAALLTPQMNEGLSPEKLTQVKPIFDQLGDPTKLTVQSRQTLPGGTKYVYLADFATAQLHVTIVIDKDGKVAGYGVTP